MGMTPEGKVKAMVNKGLAQFGRDVYRFMPVQSGYGARTLDFLVCVRGWAVYIETKRKGGVPTPIQETTIENIGVANGLVFVVDDQASCDATMDILKELPWLTRPTTPLNQPTLPASARGK